MFIISKIFTAFFLPPGIFVLALFILAFFSKYKKTLISLGIILWVLSIKITSNILLYPLKNIPTSKEKAKYVVVLGGGAVSKDVFLSSPHQFKRLVYGVSIANKENIPLIFSGGGKGESKAVINDIKRLENSFNFKIRYYIENKSKNTKENAYFTAKLFKKLNFHKKIYLVTSAWHMKRAMIDFKKAGFKVITKPTDFLSDYNYQWFDFLPNMESLYKSYLAIHEYIGILKAKFID